MAGQCLRASISTFCKNITYCKNYFFIVCLYNSTLLIYTLNKDTEIIFIINSIATV